MALKLQNGARVRIKIQGQVVAGEVTNLLHDATAKVVYVSVVMEDGSSYYSIPHHRFE